MLAVKPFVQARLNKLVIAGALVELGDFVKAVNVAVTEARKLVDFRHGHISRGSKRKAVLARPRFNKIRLLPILK